MIIRASFLLLVISCVKTVDLHDEKDYNAYIDKGNYNAFYTKRLTRRDAEKPKNDVKVKVDDAINLLNNNASENVLKEPINSGVALSEGGVVSVPSVKPEVPVTINNKTDTNIKVPQNSTNTLKVNETVTVTPKAEIKDTTVTNSTDTENLLHNPGVVKRGLIVFGGFALLAAAYFVFYRKKGKKYDSNNSHNNNDTNQFRYGVLQSEDRRDNLELSRIPLTMESDEDDEEDLEIFDLEQKKKSLSYVNLQSNDEDVVLKSSKDESKNNLLLDIEDGPSDTLINWSNSGNNSIL